MTKYDLMRAVAPSLAALALSTPAAGQQFEFDFEMLARTLGEEHLAGRNEVYGRALCGEFTGDARPDVVQMVGGTPALFCSPGIYHAVIDVPATIHSAAVLPGGAGDGRDALIVSMGRGLQACVSNAETNGWDMSPLGSQGFAGSQHLQCADMDADGHPDVIALNAAGNSLRLLLNPGGQASETTIPLPFIASEFVILDWDSEGLPEVGLVTNGSLKVVRQDGTIAFTYGIGRAGDLIAVLPTPGGADRLVATLRGASEDAWLVVASGTEGVEPPLRLGAIGVVGLAVGDVDLDGDPDLLISHQASHDIWIMKHQVDTGPSFSLDTGAIFAFPTVSDTGPAPDNHAWPVLADLDQDGDIDLTFAVQSEDWISVFRGRAMQHTDCAPTISGRLYAWDDDATEGTLELDVEAPSVTLENATHLELVVWRQNAPEQPLAREALHYALLDLDGNWPQQLSLVVSEDIESTAVHSIETRLVIADSIDEQILDAGATYAGGFATRISVLNTVSQMFGLVAGQVISLVLTGYEYGATDASDIGTGVVPMGEVPCFADDEVPKKK